MNTTESAIQVLMAAVSPEVQARRRVDLEEDSTSEIYDKLQLRVMVMKYAPSYTKWKCVGGPRAHRGKERAYYSRKGDPNLRMVVDLQTGEKRYYMVSKSRQALRRAAPVARDAAGQFVRKPCAEVVLPPIDGVSGPPPFSPWAREWGALVFPGLAPVPDPKQNGSSL